MIDTELLKDILKDKISFLGDVDGEIVFVISEGKVICVKAEKYLPKQHESSTTDVAEV